MDIAAAANLAALAAPAPAPAVHAPTAAPDDLAAARFSELMDVQPTATAQAVQEAFAPAAVAGPRTLGDAILGGMQNLSTEFQQSWRTVNAALDAGANMTMAEMLKLQIGVAQMSVQYDMVGKAISRSTQNIDQLVKMQ
ncbi:MAG TPA: type III secretion system inner rod subunit SctI [Ramlibacter sp.]|jgi:type III secretion protein I|uniref:type III secretion system inner rod subunit SctI n=1 Tax=Ramlibacter sp. TaxID=1917967 RepID=UPI002D651B62|nr:type III secretion system inner rod subunit SctI [Ramlibacter sp.]HZY20510.1 type III secretion system inner rod subunit SctI [Ramlibacter sp.]